MRKIFVMLGVLTIGHSLAFAKAVAKPTAVQTLKSSDQICLSEAQGKLKCKTLEQAKFCLENEQCQPLTQAVICTQTPDGQGQTCSSIATVLAERPTAAAPAQARVQTSAPEQQINPEERQPVKGYKQPQEQNRAAEPGETGPEEQYPGR